MNRFLQCEERTQDTFLPSRLEDYVTDDNPVRVIDVFVAELDLTKLGFEGMNPQATGRPVAPSRTPPGQRCAGGGNRAEGF
jgi:hypothetical protein